MNNNYYIPTAAYFLATFGCASLALTIIGKNLHRILKSIQGNPEGQLVLPDAILDHFGITDICFFILILIFLVPQIMLNAYRVTADSRANRFFGFLFGLLFRILPQPENILSLSDTMRVPVPSRGPVWPDGPIPWLPKTAQPVFRNAALSPVPIGKDEWRALQVLLLWMVTSIMVGFWIQNPFRLDQPSNMMWYLLPALFMAALVYYKMRFVFFDVLIKRGLVTGIFLLSSMLHFGMLLAPVQRYVGRTSAAASPLTLYGGSILFMICWMAFYGRLNGLLDRHLFRRSDYRKAASEIGELMKQFVEPRARDKGIV